MNLTRNVLTLGVAVTAVLGLGACSQQPQKPIVDCALSGTNNVDRLFAEVSEKLESPSCHYSFPGYRDRLVAAAKGAPGPENEARFAGLIRQVIDQGVISKRQGQELFSQYFDPEFYVVKSEARSSCSSLRNKDSMFAAMRMRPVTVSSLLASLLVAAGCATSGAITSLDDLTVTDLAIRLGVDPRRGPRLSR